VTAYNIGRIAGEAAKLDPGITPKTFPTIAEEEGKVRLSSIYLRLTSSRNPITAIDVQGQVALQEYFAPSQDHAATESGSFSQLLAAYYALVPILEECGR
jgi:hypothetical protein